MSTGRFIVLEGVDGAGTTTQTQALGEALRSRGHIVTTTCQPSPSNIGQLIRSLLRATDDPPDPRALALLFAADRLEHVRRLITPALDRGEVVISDRYVASSWIYQGLACEPAWVREINTYAPWPDLTLVLTIPVEVAAARVRARTSTPTELFDALELQRRIAGGYRALVADQDLPGVVEINGNAPLDAVTQALVEICIARGL